MGINYNIISYKFVFKSYSSLVLSICYAGLTQLVECLLPRQEVVSSSLITRSFIYSSFALKRPNSYQKYFIS